MMRAGVVVSSISSRRANAAEPCVGARRFAMIRPASPRVASRRLASPRVVSRRFASRRRAAVPLLRGGTLSMRVQRGYASHAGVSPKRSARKSIIARIASGICLRDA
ncbi:hypothetical protein A8H32_22550 [Burkholderia thailandensis]|nr:hypothetical protein A8H32_22550 [Burkholderia thailandensis]